MAIIAACLWVVAAFVLQTVLTARQSWPAAYGLIAVGLPLLVWLWVSAGPVAAGVACAVGCLVLRWPLVYGLRWLKRKVFP